MNSGPSTLSVHGAERKNAHAALTVPVVQTATYAFQDTREIAAHFEGRITREEYGRYGNPTVRAAEERIAALEGAEAGLCFASGMSALTTALLAMLSRGQHLVVTDDCYRRTRQLVTAVLPRFGIEATVVPSGDLRALEAALRPATRAVVSETPTNPYLRIFDVSGAAELCRARSVKLVVDATLATPVNQRPLEQGADLVVHSATKYLGGHNDLLAGAIAGRAQLVQAIRDFQAVTGGILDPHAAYLLLRGMKTLALRVARQNESAQRIAGFLESHPKVERVHYPGLASHPDHALARRQMTGFGGVISFEVRGGLEAAARVVDAVRLCTLAPSLGGVETLIEPPALMSYFDLAPEERAAIGIREGLVRLSVGIEDPADLIADLEQALAVQD